MDNSISWTSELPSGRSPFWVRDDAMAALGIARGDAVSVDTRADPVDGDLVVVEIEQDDESLRLLRRYHRAGSAVRLSAASADTPELSLPDDQLIVLGVVFGRLRFEPRANDVRVVEEPL